MDPCVAGSATSRLTFWQGRRHISTLYNHGYELHMQGLLEGAFETIAVSAIWPFASSGGEPAKSLNDRTKPIPCNDLLLSRPADVAAHLGAREAFQACTKARDPGRRSQHRQRAAWNCCEAARESAADDGNLCRIRRNTAVDERMHTTCRLHDTASIGEGRGDPPR